MSQGKDFLGKKFKCSKKNDNNEQLQIKATNSSFGFQKPTLLYCRLGMMERRGEASHPAHWLM